MSLSLNNVSKNALTVRNFLRWGKEPRLSELANFVFTDVAFEDGTILKDATFAQLQDMVWTNLSKTNLAISNLAKDSVSVTWDEAFFTWDEAEGTWDYPRSVMVNVNKNSLTISLQAKN